MPSKPSSVKEYLDSLPDDRRRVIAKVRTVIRKNIGKEFKETIQYGMLGYCLPHSVYPHGYHCDPKQPLPFAGVASQKNHIGLYLFCLYSSPGDQQRFREEWLATGRKLDMGKACVRVKKLEDIPLEVLGRAIKRATARKFVKAYESGLPASVLEKRGKKKSTRKKTARRS